jgi:hypothetical protein
VQQVDALLITQQQKKLNSLHVTESTCDTTTVCYIAVGPELCGILGNGAMEPAHPNLFVHEDSQ